MSFSFMKFRPEILILTALLQGGCGAEPKPFTLEFAATLNGAAADCNKVLTGLGPAGQHSIGVSDLRFYVSNVQFKNSDGESVALTLDDNEFQRNDPTGAVALIDLTGNSEGTCAKSAIAFAEGTARTNNALRGMTVVDDVASISFDIGVPQAVMKSVIAASTPESAPSPLNEMYWNWASGYRHFVFNFVVKDATQTSGGGYLHVGSRNCGPMGGRALTDRASCEFVNTPRLSFDNFQIGRNKVVVELSALLAGLDFISPIYDANFNEIGQGVGAECHSSPTQPDCASIFPNLGLDMQSGAAQAVNNRVFVAR